MDAILTALPTQPICQSMTVSNFQSLLKSCSTEPEMIQVQFKDLLFNRCLGGSVGKAVRILIHRWLVLWGQFPVKAILFFLILKPYNCTKMPEMSDSWRSVSVFSQPANFCLRQEPRLFAIEIRWTLNILFKIYRAQKIKCCMWLRANVWYGGLNTSCAW